MLWDLSVIVKTSRRFVSSSRCDVWRIGQVTWVNSPHSSSSSPIIHNISPFNCYQNILPVSHKYFLSVNISRCDGWLCRAGPGVSSACVPGLAPVEMCRKLCGWGETECECGLYRDTNPALCLHLTILYMHITHLTRVWMERWWVRCVSVCLFGFYGIWNFEHHTHGTNMKHILHME